MFAFLNYDNVIIMVGGLRYLLKLVSSIAGTKISANLKYTTL